MISKQGELSYREGERLTKRGMRRYLGRVGKGKGPIIY